MLSQSPHDPVFERLLRGGAAFSLGLILALLGLGGLMLILTIGKGVVDLVG